VSNYTKSTNFATKDSLPSGDPLKIVKGTEIDTEFNNIATAVATKVDSSGALGTPTSGVLTNATGLPIDAGTVGTLPIARGGTNATTASAARTSLGLAIGTDVPSPTGTGASGNWGINITGNAATATTASNGGVTSVNGSTGAVTVDIVPSSISAIGTVLIAANTSTSNLLPGNTIAGSSLYYPSTITLVGTNIYTEGTGAAPNTYLSAGAGKNIIGASERVTSGNTGYTVPGGHTALSGTWRVLSTVAARSSVYDSETNATFSYSPSVLVQRIS